METDSDRDLVTRDVPKALTVLNDVKHQVDFVFTSVAELLRRIKSGEFPTTKGISLLELKCQLLLSYMINLTYVALKKAGGNSIEGDEAVLRLAELRTVLEKMRPFEQKLKYHIDKVMKVATGNANENDPLRYSANPNNLISKLHDDGSSDSEGEESSNVQKADSKVYVPPKLAPVHYDDDVDKEERQQRLIQQARRKAFSSSIMHELKAEYYDGPEEIREFSGMRRKGLGKEARRRTEYEEEYFMRFNISKKEKHAMKQMTSGLQDITHFRDISALNTDADEYCPPKKKKKGDKQKMKNKKFSKKFH